jgi:hypothetical protein
MPFVELVGEDLRLPPAVGALASKGFQVLELLETRTMLRCGHAFLLFSKKVVAPCFIRL